MYLCTQNYDLKRGGTFETAMAGTFHSVTAGTSIPLFTKNAKERLESAWKLKNNGVPLDIITRSLNLTEEETKKL